MRAQNVVVYISNQCEQSDKLLHFLVENNISFEKKNVSEYKANMKELQRLNVFSTPAIFVDDQKVLGFQKNQLQRLIGISSW
ncbi:glutaredoxin family protein [Aquibacillus sediminis]|uniref:glutaredoxin family protein n=1 Tax=Aquibacillus sediminis TaxID=2574734 RepID=UPI001485F385|nr:glutaredoxin family protein [Aquibacillus sediminis]